MKRLLLIVALFSLCGCDQWRKTTGLNDTPVPIITPPPPKPPPVTPPGPPPPAPQNIYVLFAGQSNILADNGLSEAFVSQLQSTGIQVTPIQCAVGGTSIDEWQKGGTLYDTCVSKIGSSTPKAIIWWQGEADVSKPSYGTWGVSFQQMVHDFRTDLGYTIPIIYVRISMANANPYMAGTLSIRSQQETLSISSGWMFSIDPWESYIWVGHEPHYITEGYQLIGQALANNYLGHNIK